MPPDPHDADTWRIVAWLNHNSAWITAGILCFVIALLRSVMDNGRVTRKDVAESLICGLMVSVSRPVLTEMTIPFVGIQINDQSAMFIAGMVGFLGVRYMRPLIEKVSVLRRGGREK